MRNTPPQPRRRVEPGQVIEIGEADYCYGVGTLKLRVTRVAPNQHPGLEWLRVIGTEVRWDGKDGDPRDVLVRVSALPSR